MLQHKPAFGGTVVALIASRTRPEMATVRPGMLAPGEARRGRRAEIVEVDAPAAVSRVRVESRRRTAEAAAVLDHAEVVVGFGKGIGGPENLPVIEALAEALGGALCTTRDVTDAGWMAKQYQVGLTGRAIAPKLYLAVALRGAFEHTVGIRRAGLVVAINKSAKAPIFKVCDYGIVGDYAVLVPLLTRRAGGGAGRGEPVRKRGATARAEEESGESSASAVASAQALRSAGWATAQAQAEGESGENSASAVASAQALRSRRLRLRLRLGLRRNPARTQPQP